MKIRMASEMERSAEQVLDQLMGSGRYPRLAALAGEGPGAPALRAELLALVEKFVEPRARRAKKKIFAKILRDTDKGSIEEPVVIRDISATGTLLAVPLHTGLSARDLKEVRLKLRMPGIDDFLVRARLVRVSGADSDFVYAGFSFDGAPLGLAALLGELEHATNVRGWADSVPSPSRSPSDLAASSARPARSGRPAANTSPSTGATSAAEDTAPGQGSVRRGVDEA